MDWGTIGSLVVSAAPTIGSLLGGLIPFPGGAILGQVAGKVLAEALGVPATPDAINTAITTGDPATIQAKLSEAEAKMQAEVDKHKADLADIADARAANIQLVQAGSSIAWGPAVISVMVTAGFIGCVFALMVLKIDFSQTSGQAFLILTGVLSQAFAQVTGYWLGSSAGSADKSNQIAALAGVVGQQPALPTKPVIRPVAKK